MLDTSFGNSATFTSTHLLFVFVIHTRQQVKHEIKITMLHIKLAPVTVSPDVTNRGWVSRRGWGRYPNLSHDACDIAPPPQTG